MSPPLRIGALISGGGTNLQAIIDACESGDLNARMVFTGSDNPDAGGLKRAAAHGIPQFVVDYREILRRAREEEAEPPADFDFNEIRRRQRLLPADTPEDRLRRYLAGRARAEAALLAKMKGIPFDLLILAGFMRTLTPYFIDRVNTDADLPRIMNIHPALLPAFPGVDGYGDTFRYGCKVGGCTVHFIDYGEDTGPIIGQMAYAVKPGEELADIKKKGLALEWQLYPACIRLYEQKRLRIDTMRHEAGGRIIQRRVVRILPAPPV